MNIEVRQGIKYNMICDDGRRVAKVGLVIDVCDDLAYVLPVAAICKMVFV